jgi:hypothetical protein
MWWKIWAKALGSKTGKTDREADKVAIVRTVLVLFEVVVGIFIILNAIANHGIGLII